MEQFCESSWFKRGWTLQELLAPKNIRFYNRTWHFIGTKDDLANEISNTTEIEVRWLNTNIPSDYRIIRCTRAEDCQAHAWPGYDPSVAMRMN